MLKIPHFTGKAHYFLKSGFKKRLVSPGISRMDILGDAENHTVYRAQLKKNRGVTPRFS